MKITLLYFFVILLRAEGLIKASFAKTGTIVELHGSINGKGYNDALAIIQLCNGAYDVIVMNEDFTFEKLKCEDYQLKHAKFELPKEKNVIRKFIDLFSGSTCKWSLRRLSNEKRRELQRFTDIIYDIDDDFRKYYGNPYLLKGDLNQDTMHEARLVGAYIFRNYGHEGMLEVCETFKNLRQDLDKDIGNEFYKAINNVWIGVGVWDGKKCNCTYRNKVL